MLSKIQIMQPSFQKKSALNQEAKVKSAEKPVSEKTSAESPEDELQGTRKFLESGFLEQAESLKKQVTEADKNSDPGARAVGLINASKNFLTFIENSFQISRNLAKEAAKSSVNSENPSAQRLVGENLFAQKNFLLGDSALLKNILKKVNSGDSNGTDSLEQTVKREALLETLDAIEKKRNRRPAGFLAIEPQQPYKSPFDSLPTKEIEKKVEKAKAEEVLSGIEKAKKMPKIGFELPG